MHTMMWKKLAIIMTMVQASTIFNLCFTGNMFQLSTVLLETIRENSLSSFYLFSLTFLRTFPVKACSPFLMLFFSTSALADWTSSWLNCLGSTVWFWASVYLKPSKVSLFFCWMEFSKLSTELPLTASCRCSIGSLSLLKKPPLSFWYFLLMDSKI